MKIDISSLHPLELKILRTFSKITKIWDREFSSRAQITQAQVRTAVEWLVSRELLTKTCEKENEKVSLTEIGAAYAEQRLPELRIYESIKELGGVPAEKVRARDDMDPKETGSAFGYLKQNGFIDMAEGVVFAVEGARPDELYTLQALIEKVAIQGILNFEEFEANEKENIQGHFRKRGKSKGILRLDKETEREYRLTDAGITVLKEILEKGVTGEEVSQLTPSMLKDGSWKKLRFRRYNLGLPPSRIIAGRKNPFRAFLDRARQTLLSMGFEEMRGSIVETEFWNMDALYMPQFHPARNVHDNYFIKKPTHAKTLDEPFCARVAEVHEHGGTTGSSGWEYKFDREQAKKLILRTQGTVLSARALTSSPKIPGKYFAFARCFRPDNVDASHAVDFIQVEGIVLEPEINFRHLLGLLRMFAQEIAQAKEFKFLPAYFPFTEPSVEAHMKHPDLGWMELGGAGIFRPEVTAPFGIDVPVIAWGLGFDRMAMMTLGINDIRDLFTSDLDIVRAKNIPPV